MSGRTPVFDYHAGIVWERNERIQTAMEETYAERGAKAALDRLKDEQVRELRANPDFRARYRAVYEQAGITIESPSMFSLDPSMDFREGIRRDLERWQARFDAVDWMEKVITPGQARAVTAAGRVGFILNTQHLDAATDGVLSNIDRLFDAGLRIMQLTYNNQNRIGTGCTDRSDGGLSNYGLDAVARMNDLGAIIDISHSGKQTTLDAIDHSNQPVAATHACCGALSGHDRAKSDEELRALADADGYLGIFAVPGFLGPTQSDPGIDVFFDHVEHAVEVMGVDKVGIGTDFGDIDVGFPEILKEAFYSIVYEELGFREEHKIVFGEGFDTFQRYNDFGLIATGLSDRFSPGDVDRLLGENFISFWERVVD